MDLPSAVRGWVRSDNRLTELNAERRNVLEDRNKYASAISSRMHGQSIGISDGALKVVTTRQKQPLTLKYVEDCLRLCISSESDVRSIMSVISANRAVRESVDIKRSFSK